MSGQNTQSNINFELHSLIRDITKSIWSIILAGCIALMSLYIYSTAFHTPQYTSTALLAVRSKVATTGFYTGLSTTSQMTQVFAEVFKQSAMKKRAAENLGLDSFDGNIAVRVQSETNIMTISVTADTPVKAFVLLTSVLEVYPDISDAVFSNSVIDVLSTPQMPFNSSNGISAVRYGQVMVLAMLLEAGIVVMLSLIRNTIKNEGSFKGRVDSNLIGTVTHEKSHLSFVEKLKGKKRALLIDDAYTSLKFAEEYQRIANKLEYIHNRKGCKVFTITSVAENEGKSTASVNIALALAARGYKIALLDLDVRKPSIYKIFEFKDEISVELSDVLSGNARLEDFRFYRYRKTDLLLALNKKSRMDSVNWLSSSHSVSCISDIAAQMDYVIIDTPPLSVSADAAQLTTLADRTLLVVRTDMIAAEDINDAVLSITNSGGELLGCILNDVYKSFTMFGQIGATEDRYYNSRSYGRYAKDIWENTLGFEDLSDNGEYSGQQKQEKDNDE